MVAGRPAGRLQRTAQGLRLDLTPPEPGFADWLESEADSLLTEFYDRWKQQS